MKYFLELILKNLVSRKFLAIWYLWLNIGLGIFNVGFRSFNVRLGIFYVGFRSFNVGLKTFNIGLRSFNIGLRSFNVGLKSFNVGLKYYNVEFTLPIFVTNGMPYMWKSFKCEAQAF